MKIQVYLSWLLFVGLSFYLLLVGKDLLVPLVIAIIVWYLTNVLAAAFGRIRVGRFHLSKPVCFVSAILMILGALWFIINLITINIADVISVAPQYQENLTRVVGRFFRLAGLSEPPTVRQVFTGLDFRSGLSRFAVALGGIFGNAGIILVYLVLLFLEQSSFRQKFRALFPNPEKRSELQRIIAHIDEDIRSYVGIKTFTSALTGLTSYVVMALLGLDFASFWAILIFLFNYIPTFGSIVATLFPTILALVQFPNILPFFIVGTSIGGLQFLIGNVLEPRLMGGRLNLSPLIILLSLALWGAIWGVTGMILSVPIMAMLIIVFSHFPQTRTVAVILSRRGQIKND